MIRIRELTKRFGERVILNGVNLHLGAGEFAFLQGRSGSGKSTLLKLLYRDLEPDSGSMEVEGVAVSSLKKYELRRKMGIIFQNFELLERKNVIENILVAGEVQGKNRYAVEAEALRLLQQVGLSGREHLFPEQLSGGEQQRVAIARALLNRPALLLADEPTGNLDAETALDIMRLLQDLQQTEGTAMLIVTHSEQWMQSYPLARRLRMENGQVHENDNH